MQRAQSGNAECQHHCRLGGHPNPHAAFLLPGRSGPFSDGLYLWLDLGHYLERGWGLLLSAVQATGWSEGIPALHVQAVAGARTRWHQQDVLASRLPAGVFEDH